MIFKRKIYEKMLEWKNISKGKSALMIEGARRVGKSTIAEEFARNEFDSYLVLNFAEESDEIRRNFKENIGDLDTFFRNLFVLKEQQLKETESVIIFDEVQLFPLARQAIKTLVADGRYCYIETGSLISIKKNVKDILIPSEEHKLKMYPMDFEEFLWAKDDKATMPAIEEAFLKRNALGNMIHNKIMQVFRTYVAVGGMPQAVEAFVNGDTYQRIDNIKRDILTLYEDDLKKYDEENREKASVIFKAIPEQLTNRNSNFKLFSLDKNARHRNYIDAIDFVAESMIGNACINVTDPDVTPALFADRSNFKLYMGDTGLLVTKIMNSGNETEENLYKSLIFNKLGINQGMIMENMVAQMLKSQGRDLYFHEFLYKAEGVTKENKYEIDFLIVNNKRICPIEVKSSGYKRHKSFDYFIKKYQLKTNERYVINTKDLHVDADIVYIPLYITMLI